ncbi:hypothetical protein AVEN_227611-1 [Araneus ventricosus]|uniref:Uncharacterized protein n=1 Tax=Araneus ventricosus TaxID=182803 RepID=A0A4Y2SP15_ARAVE|nr:hypothetical protein AVEN_227611-1 [Araneus ventricosus]
MFAAMDRTTQKVFIPSAFGHRWRCRHIKTDLLKMASPEKKSQCTLGYVMFLWDYLKNVAHRTKVHSVVELKQRIQAAIEIVDKGMLQLSWMELEYRLDIIRATKGSHVELY